MLYLLRIQFLEHYTCLPVSIYPCSAVTVFMLTSTRAIVRVLLVWNLVIILYVGNFGYRICDTAWSATVIWTEGWERSATAECTSFVARLDRHKKARVSLKRFDGSLTKVDSHTVMACAENCDFFSFHKHYLVTIVSYNVAWLVKIVGT